MRSIFGTILFLVVALLVGYLITQYSPTLLMLAIATLVIFLISFLNIEWGLYILIFSMLLSPEFMAGDTTGGSLNRGVTLRLEDFLLAVIGLSWFAKNAINKELGLFLKTPSSSQISLIFYSVISTSLFSFFKSNIMIRLPPEYYDTRFTILFIQIHIFTYLIII